MIEKYQIILVLFFGLHLVLVAVYLYKLYEFPVLPFIEKLFAAIILVCVPFIGAAYVHRITSVERFSKVESENNASGQPLEDIHNVTDDV